MMPGHKTGPCQNVCGIKMRKFKKARLFVHSVKDQWDTTPNTWNSKKGYSISHVSNS